MTPQPTPDVSFRKPEIKKPSEESLNRSIRVVEAQTAPSGMTSVVVHEEPSPRDSIRLEESRSSSASSTCDWYPKNMKEFKALSKEKKSEFFSKLKAASRKRSERSSCAS